MQKHTIAIIGGGPAGLIAAERLAARGYAVTIYDRMPSVARKFLMAGRGGLNLTHSEPLADFIGRYGTAAAWLAPYIRAFPPDALRHWCEGLDQSTFVGTSGRVFPVGMKATPLLRAWLRRLVDAGVQFMLRHEWQGWHDGALRFMTPEGEKLVQADACLLALGGASWPRLGTDGGWVPILTAAGIALTPLRPSNCGFIVPWSDYFRARFAGAPLKNATFTHSGPSKHGEAVITQHGIEGGAIYALSAGLRDSITAHGSAVLTIDLVPQFSLQQLAAKLTAPRGSQSASNYLRKTLNLAPVQIGLLHEVFSNAQLAATPEQLAALIKAVPVTLTATAGMARAISSAGGVPQAAVDAQFMLHDKPGVFVAGEMLDWEAPTGGYLLQGCFCTGIAAANGVHNWLETRN